MLFVIKDMGEKIVSYITHCMEPIAHSHVRTAMQKKIATKINDNFCYLSFDSYSYFNSLVRIKVFDGDTGNHAFNVYEIPSAKRQQEIVETVKSNNKLDAGIAGQVLTTSNDRFYWANGTAHQGNNGYYVYAGQTQTLTGNTGIANIDNNGYVRFIYNR